jgi:iron complex outermembrane recepter protein
VGFRLAGVPEHAFSAWMKYTIQEGTFKGLGFGLGGRYYSAQQGDQTYTTRFQLPAYGILDAAISYERGPFHAQINVTNLLDREYYAGAYSDLYVLPGEPLNVRATVGWKF